MKKTIPVKVGQLCDVTIDDLSHDGLGIARVDGFLLFVADALPDERVVARIISAKKKYGHAKAIEWLKKSPSRVIPPCPLFEQCGGCQIQHMSDEAQLEFKKQIVVRNLEKFGKIIDPPVKDVIGMDAPWRYRNKTQIPFGRDAEGKLVAGFYKNRSHEIIDMPSCLVQTEVADEIVLFVKQLAKEHRIEPYDEQTGSGVLRHVVVRTGFKIGELMVIFVTNSKRLPHQEALCQRLTEAFPAIKSIAHNVNEQVTNVIFGEETAILAGEPYIVDELDGLKFLISPRSFYQINPVQTEVLYRQALEYAAVDENSVVFDAYCGIGTITLFLARKAKAVYGVEIVPDAIADAKKNAKANGLDNAVFEVGKSEVVIPRLIEEGIVPDVIVVDPPRKGCDVVLLDAMIKARPKRIVYVSCDSATLARDVAILADGGYVLDVVQPVDMFPQTSHVETVALLTRVETL